MVGCHMFFFILKGTMPYTAPTALFCAPKAKIRTVPFGLFQW